MSSQSPQRSRKGPGAAAPQRREASPSPSRKEQQREGNRPDRQRYVRTQSMPISGTVGVAAAAQSSPKQLQQLQRQDSPSSPHSSLKNVPPQQQLVDFDDSDGLMMGGAGGQSGNGGGVNGPVDFANESNEQQHLDIREQPQRAHSFAGTSSSQQLQSHSPPHLNLQQQQQQQQMAQATVTMQTQPAPYPALAYAARPVARVPPPQFLSSRPQAQPVPVPNNNSQRSVNVTTGEWEMTDEIMADIERADFLQNHSRVSLTTNNGPPAPGTEGVAYAGGVLSFASRLTAQTVNVVGSGSPPKAPGNVDKSAASAVKEDGHASGGSSGHSRRQSGQQSQQQVQQQQQRGRENGQTQTRAKRSNSRPLTPPERDSNANANVAARTSPPHNNTLNNMHYPTVQVQASTPPALRRTSNNISPLTTAGSPGPVRALKNRTPDRSLPVQEEPDEHEQEMMTQRHHHHGIHPSVSPSPAPSSDLNPENDLLGLNNNDDHDGATLVNQEIRKFDRDVQTHSSSGDDDTEEGAHTPRSPSAPPYEHHGQDASRGIHDVISSEPPLNDKMYPNQPPPPAFDPNAFQQTMKKLQSDSRLKAQEDLTNSNANNINNLTAELNLRQQFQIQQQQRYQQTPYSRNDSRNTYPNWIPDYYQNYPDELDMDFLEEEAYLQQQIQNAQYLPTPQSAGTQQQRPGAPIPPTPHSQSQSEQQQPPPGPREPVPRSLVPPFSPAPPGGTPYPYPFSHMRRGFTYQSQAGGGGGPQAPPRVTSSVYDPAYIQEQLALQMQMAAINNAAANGGMMSDSTLSPSSTPFPGTGPMYTPFGAFISQTRRMGGRGFGINGGFAGLGVHGAMGDGGGGGGRLTRASTRSSPSHLPVPLPAPAAGGRGRNLKKRDRFTNGINNSGNKKTSTLKPPRIVNPPPRVESTQPRDTSPESFSGEETAGEKFDDIVDVSAGSTIEASVVAPDEADDEDENGDDDEWVDEEIDEEEDLLDLEFHPSFISNRNRRQKRWDQRWEELVRAFQVLDRETDGTLMLLGAPSHSSSLHLLQSRSIRRDASLFDSHAMHVIRSNFSQIAAQRRQARSKAERISLLDRLYSLSQASSHSGDGSGTPSSSASNAAREEDLRRALKTALESLNAMRNMYETREARWREEEKRIAEEREGMELLITQAFGPGAGMVPNGGIMGNGM